MFARFFNLFNPSTKINYTIAKQGFVNIKIFDVLGREITTLVNKEQSSGNYELELCPMPSGEYEIEIFPMLDFMSMDVMEKKDGPGDNFGFRNFFLVSSADITITADKMTYLVGDNVTGFRGLS